jgi:hypothetical protein
MKEGLLVMHRTRCKFYFDCVGLSVLLDLLQVFVIAVLCQSAKDIPVQPIYF